MLGALTYTVRRQASGAHVDGIWTPGAETSFELEGSLQPMRGHELLVLPEGQRGQARWKIYTTTLLQTIDEDTSTPADRLEVDGKDLVVVKVQAYQHGFGTDHYRCELVADETGREQ